MGIIVPILTLIFLLLTRVSHAESKPRVILVGGSAGSWKVPDHDKNTLNHWAEKNRFKVGDILEWKYDGKSDSVLQVTEEDYNGCKTTKPLKKFNDGDTKIKLKDSGAHFFISGASDHCVRGEKITLRVMPEGKTHGGIRGSPKVSPSAPAPAPSAAVGLKVGSGLFLTAVAIGLAMV
ncbi:unnamed protein product [Eruca vesicaria subsp. sativa]|uniref:Phytocyanin domain-containing protein n=1 Tax=Eruca vesicaria subsp. sativa TaxID=29727 RepID=A0ABC8K2L9_ERUVS|nr:unnamed protein product [Eruca vesicaria subsp. sativa]